MRAGSCRRAPRWRRSGSARSSVPSAGSSWPARISDCGDCGRSIRTMRGRRRDAVRRERLGRRARAAGGRQLPNRLSSWATKSAQRQVADREDGGVVGPDPGLVEGDQLVAGQRPTTAGSPVPRARLAVGMLGPVEQAAAARARRCPAAGSSRLAMPASCCWRMRSTSAGAKAGLRITSASRSSDGAEIGRQRGQRDRRSGRGWRRC